MINKFKINQILQCFRSAPGYSLALAQAHAGREIASLSYPEGEPAHSLILNLKLVNRVLAPPQGAGGSVSMLSLIIF
jgi:hypothetical protein